jgi:sulfoxide reductase heme-binding subunit YedZ
MGAAPRWLNRVWAKPGLMAVLLLPVAWLFWAAASDGLGANPAEALVRSTGDWTLRMLCAVLAVTPLRRWTGWAALARFRRMLGLTVYFYACLHLLAYAWLDMGLDWDDLWADVLKRRFIFVGMSAWLLLTALALTSFNAAIRRLGAANWKRLHRVVYGVALLAILHFWWMRSGKHNFADVWLYGGLLGGLLLTRLQSEDRRKKPG